MMEIEPCYQCGRNEPSLADERDPDWVICNNCGSRLMSGEEFRAAYDKAEEDRMRAALGL